jgi:hypothetical protein
LLNTENWHDILQVICKDFMAIKGWVFYLQIHKNLVFPPESCLYFPHRRKVLPLINLSHSASGMLARSLWKMHLVVNWIWKWVEQIKQIKLLRDFIETLTQQNSLWVSQKFHKQLLYWTSILPYDKITLAFPIKLPNTSNKENKDEWCSL